MDPVTHTLVGVALSRAGLWRVTPRATLLLVIASNFPDIDLIALISGPLAALKYHAGYTHSLIALPVLALACAVLARILSRERLPFLKAWMIGCVGIASHLLLDWACDYGIRPFLPFSSRWSYLDLNGLYDGVLLIALGAALVWPWFVGLVSGEIGSRRQSHKGQGSAILVLLFLLLYEGGRWSLHQHALNDLNSRLYDEQMPLNVAAIPDANNPFEWTGIVETQDAFRVVMTGSLDLLPARDARVFSKPEETAAYKAVMQTELFRYMAYFVRFPVWGIEPVMSGGGVGKLFDLTDLRFGNPGKFHAVALTDAAGRVLESKFSF